MPIPELQAIRNSIKEKQRQNKLSVWDAYGVKNLTPYNALERLPKNKTILYK